MFTAATKNKANKSNNTPLFQNNEKARQTFFQPKLNVGTPGDKYEVEADKIADQVVDHSPVTEQSFFMPSVSPPVNSGQPAPVQHKPVADGITPLLQKQGEEEMMQMQPAEEEEIVQRQAEEEEEMVQGQTEEEEVVQQQQDDGNKTSVAETAGGETLQQQTENIQSAMPNPAFSAIQKQEVEEEDPAEVQASEDEERRPVMVEKEGQVQAKADSAPVVPAGFESGLNGSKGSGSPLPSGIKSQMESGFDTDFSNVRIHTDSNATQMSRQIGAQAFTHGSDIFFNEGKYKPESDSGKHLLAHELTHTVQQREEKLIQGKLEKPESKIEDDVNEQLPTYKNKDEPQKDDLKTEEPDRNTEVKSTDINNDTSSVNADKQLKQPDETAKKQYQNNTKSSNDVLDQDFKTPIDKPPNQSQLKNTEDNAEKNMQASQSKKAKNGQKHAKLFNKKGQGKTNEKKGVKSIVDNSQFGSNNNSLEVSTIDFTTDLPKIPNTRSLGGKVLLTKINESYLQFQQQFLNRYQQKKESLSDFVTLQQQELTETGVGIEQRITNAITHARATIVNSIVASQGQVASHRANQDGVLTSSENSSTSNVSTIFTTGQTNVTDEATTLASRSIQTANDSANQLQTNVTQSVNEARNVGEQKANVSDADAGVRSAKQRTAREIAADTAEKIAGGRADAEQKIRSTGPMASQEFLKQGREASSQLILGKSEVDNELVNIFSNAKVGVKSIEESSNESLEQTQTQLLDQLAELEKKLLQQLRKEIDKKIADLYIAGQQTIDLFDEQAQQSLTKSRMQLENNNSEIAAANISEQKVDEAHSLAVNEISDGFFALNSSVENSAQEATQRVAEQNTQLKGKLGNTQSVISSQIDTFSSNARSQIDQSKGNTISQLNDATGQAVSASNQIVAQVDTNIAEQVTTINQNFTSGFEDFEGNLGTQVNEATQEARTPLRDLNSRIDQGQARAATRVERSWLSNQWHDAVEMLSSPGFWAGLIVGLILTVVFILLIAGTALTGGALLLVLVAGFAVIGAVAAAVGSVVNQATNNSFSGGWDWSRVDWGQVGMAALFGAAAGAVFAVVAFVAVEVFAVAVASWTFVGIMSVTAGVITVITNLINGQPWDKDLLINMTIAGFFAWLARFFPGGRGRPTEEAPPDAPEPLPRRPGDPDGPKVRPPEPEVPAPIRAGQEIVINDPSRLSYTTPRLEGGYWKWNLVDTETGAIFTQYVKATSNTGPDMYLTPRNARIPGIGEVRLKAEGFRWTTEANRLNMEAYEATFGNRPPNLNGQIWASNLDRFVVNYDQVRAQNPGSSPQAIADAAIRSTSFGQGKIEQGYGNLRVVMDGVEFGDVTINGKTYNNVPRNDVAIDVIAEPTSP